MTDPFDQQIRACLHERWDGVPRPKRRYSSLVQTHLGRQNMARSLRMVAIAVLALVLVGAVFFTTRPLAPVALNVQEISANPERYLLRYEELPANTDYYEVGARDNQARPRPLTVKNENLPSYFGPEKSAQFLSDYERVNGWYIQYQRRQADAPGIEWIVNWITVHQTPEGAQKLVRDNPVGLGPGLYWVYPRETLGPIDDLGDLAQATKIEMPVSPGFERTLYQVDFAYQTVSVRVQVSDLSSRVTLEDAVAYARIVLRHLQE